MQGARPRVRATLQHVGPCVARSRDVARKVRAPRPQQQALVESRLGASTDAERRPVSQPRSSNRTCRFPASGFPTGFTADSRTSPPVVATTFQVRCSFFALRYSLI